jgi:hypothetical protein
LRGNQRPTLAEVAVRACPSAGTDPPFAPGCRQVRADPTLMRGQIRATQAYTPRPHGRDGHCMAAGRGRGLWLSSRSPRQSLPQLRHCQSPARFCSSFTWCCAMGPRRKALPPASAATINRMQSAKCMGNISYKIWEWRRSRNRFLEYARMRARPAGPAESSVFHYSARSGPTKEAHRRALNRPDGLLRSEAGRVGPSGRCHWLFSDHGGPGHHP